MQKLFGTDGIRGTANQYPVTAEIALKLGMAAGLHFNRGNHRHRVVIGKDTRLSGYMLEAALESGFTAAGMDVVLVGPMPTPAIAMLVRSLRADLGVMISASHNEYQDNGIKLFGPDGLKLSDEAEISIEVRILSNEPLPVAAPDQLGRARRLDDAQGRYIEFAKNTFPKHLTLDGLKIVVDCAHGAAYQVAPLILRELGAEVIPIGIAPDGFNINRECGSTAPKLMCEAVLAHRANLGIALDGDADRLIVCDEKGTIADGDQLMALIAADWHGAGKLTGGGIAATVMSNMGLEKYLATLKLSLKRTKVGDRYVGETMREAGMNLGGEQSGHIILSDYVTTGDGLIAALQLLAVMKQKERPFSELAHVFTPLPQVLRNIRFKGVSPLKNEKVQSSIDKLSQALGQKGRVLIRESGTEPLVRVMVECEDRVRLTQLADELCGIIERAVAA